MDMILSRILRSKRAKVLVGENAKEGCARMARGALGEEGRGRGRASEVASEAEEAEGQVSAAICRSEQRWLLGTVGLVAAKEVDRRTAGGKARVWQRLK